jgi:hypothetical protein
MRDFNHLSESFYGATCVEVISQLREPTANQPHVHHISTRKRILVPGTVLENAVRS